MAAMNRIVGSLRVEEHVMRPIGMIAAALLLAAGLTAGLGPAASARATTKDDVAINGTYRATSIGGWAKTNDTYHNEATVISTWTITSTCMTAQDCTGTVTSDRGWSAPLVMRDGTLWYVKRDVPNWETCPDGSTYTGQQTYYFYPVDANGQTLLGSPTLAGLDKTVGPSGACGQSRWLVIEMPLRLDKIA